MGNVSQLLEEYPYIIEEIKEIEKQLQERIMAHLDKQDTLKAMMLSDMPKGGGEQDQVCVLVQKLIDDYVSDILLLNKKLDELNEKRRKAELLIIKLSPTDYKIIKLRHFEHMAFWKIGKILKCSKNKAWEIHQEIINSLGDGTERTERTISS